jgi:predicted porin
MKNGFAGLVTLAACAGASLTAQAQSTVAIYGRLDTSVDILKVGTASQQQVRDNASRLGFRGTEDLGGGLKGVFGLEMGINSDSGATTTPTFRNSFVALTGGFGGVALGRLDSANPTGSPIYSLVTRHTDFVVHDAGATAVGTAVLNARNRVSNAIGYQSPTFGNLVFRARYYLNGEGVAESATGPIRFESDFKSLDLSLSYGEAGGPLGLGVGFGKDDRRGGTPTNGFKDKWMAVGSYDFGAVSAWAIVGQDKYNGTATTRSKVDIRYIGASANVGGAGRVIANYSTRDVQSNPNAQLKKISLGYAHRLSKRTQLFAIFDRTDPNTKVADNTVRVLSFGVQHNF